MALLVSQTVWRQPRLSCAGELPQAAGFPLSEMRKQTEKNRITSHQGAGSASAQQRRLP